MGKTNKPAKPAPKTTMTVTRALSTLKLLDKKISKATRTALFANYTVGGKLNKEPYTPESDLQSVEDLIDYRSRLKSEIMKSNAKTTVKIGKNKMTVVEAIETKDSIKYRKELLNKIIGDLGKVSREVENINFQVGERLDGMMRSSFGNDVKPSEKDYEAIAGPFLKNNEARDVDSEKFGKIAMDMSDDIDTFEAEVDLVLSESNSTTTIEV